MSYLEPGSRDWETRLVALLDSESAQPETWWYLSFAADTFLGAAFVRGRGMMTAVTEAGRLGCNPGGGVQGMPVPDDLVEENVPEDARNRLLSFAEMEAFGWDPVGANWPDEP